MPIPYEEQVAEVFSRPNDGFGSAATTPFEFGALRALYEQNGRDRDTTLRAIQEHGYPAPTEITAEMVAVTGVAHACGVAIRLAQVRGIAGKDSTYESYTAKNRFDRFTALHLPDELRAEWDAPIGRVPDANPDMHYPAGIDITKVRGVGKPSRYLPAQTMRHLEFARLGKLDQAARDALGLGEVADLSQLAVPWDSLIPTIESATSTTQLAGDIGAQVGKQLLENGLTPSQVATFLQRSYAVDGFRAEHGEVSEADAVYAALVSSLASLPDTTAVSELMAR